MNTLQAKEKVTFFHVNNAFAMTTKSEVIIDRETDTHIIFKESSRKRKLYQIAKKNLSILFKGHNLPIGADSDGNVMRGNAMLNLVSEMPLKDVKEYIDKNNLVEPTEDMKAHMVLMNPEQASDSNYKLTINNLLYPDAIHSSSMVDSIRNGSY